MSGLEIALWVAGGLFVVWVIYRMCRSSRGNSSRGGFDVSDIFDIFD